MSLRFQGVGGGGTRAHEEVTQKWLSWECVLGGLCLGLSNWPEHMAEELSPPFPPLGGLVSTPGGTQSELSSDRETRKRNWRAAGGRGSFQASLDLCPLGRAGGALGLRPNPYPRAPASPRARLPSTLVLSTYSCSVLAAVSL